MELERVVLFADSLASELDLEQPWILQEWPAQTVSLYLACSMLAYLLRSTSFLSTDSIGNLERSRQCMLIASVCSPKVPKKLQDDIFQPVSYNSL